MEKNFFPEQEVQEARDANLVVLLEMLGIPLKRSGREYMHPAHDSLKISATDGWKWHSKNDGGNAVDYLERGPDFNYNFYEAVKVIRNTLGLDKNKSDIKPKTSQTTKDQAKDQKTKMLILPKRYSDNKRVCAYLNITRGIDYEFINKCIKHDLLYESEKTHNAVFLGKDFSGNVKYAYQRGTNTFKKFVGDIDGSQKEYNFRLEGSSQTLRVFESPIDVLSFLTLAKFYKISCNDTFLSLGGVSVAALDMFLKESNKKIQSISVCTDNDQAGKSCLEEIQTIYSQEYKVMDNRPKQYKDYNEQLMQTLNFQKGLER